MDNQQVCEKFNTIKNSIKVQFPVLSIPIIKRGYVETQNYQIFVKHFCNIPQQDNMCRLLFQVLYEWGTTNIKAYSRNKMLKNIMKEEFEKHDASMQQQNISKIFHYLLIKGKPSCTHGNIIKLPKHTEFCIQTASCSERKLEK